MIIYCSHCKQSTRHDTTTITVAGRQVTVYICRVCSTEKQADKV